MSSSRHGKPSVLLWRLCVLHYRVGGYAFSLNSEDFCGKKATHSAGRMMPSAACGSVPRGLQASARLRHQHQGRLRGGQSHHTLSAHTHSFCTGRQHRSSPENGKPGSLENSNRVFFPTVSPQILSST